MKLRLLALVSAFALTRGTADSCLKFLGDNRPNRTIVFWGKQAGLYDRYTIIRALKLLSKRARARFYFPPPCKMLSKSHNGGKGTSCALKWSAFLDVSKFADMLLASYPSHPDLFIHDFWKECHQFMRQSMATLLKRDLPLAPCVTLEAAHFVKKWISDNFIYVHLRLGQDHEDCDQSFPAILKKLSDLILKYKMSGQHIVISSNWNLSAHFLHNVAEVTKAKVIWLDSILQQFRNTNISANNYMMFNLEIAIMKRALYTITWERSFKCGEVACYAACRNATDVFHTTPAAACGNVSAILSRT